MQKQIYLLGILFINCKLHQFKLLTDTIDAAFKFEDKSQLPKVVIHGLEEKLVVWSIEDILKVGQSHLIGWDGQFDQIGRLFVVDVVNDLGLHAGREMCARPLPHRHQPTEYSPGRRANCKTVRVLSTRSVTSDSWCAAESTLLVRTALPQASNMAVFFTAARSFTKT